MTTSGTLHLLIGPVGAGKSTYGARRADSGDGLWLDVDTWMVRLYGGDPRPTENVVAWYLERRQRCRELLWDLTSDLLRGGVNVFLEFGLVTADERRAFYERCAAAEMRFDVLLFDAPRDVRRSRVMERNAAPRPFAQVVPLEFFERASDLWQEPSDAERRDVPMIDI
jgi:predicted kinase